MKYILSIVAICLLVLSLSCKSKEEPFNSTIEVIAEFSELQTLINAQDHEVLVMNFWSTTCAPCIKEMPHFNTLNTSYDDKKVKILLVSLEKAKRLDTHIYPFVKKLGIVPEVVVLTDPNYNIWTDNIDTSWYGALPATLITKGDKRKFRFGSYESYEELQADVEELLGEQ
ncbi:MAG: TlpA family protein disulfide reductase [Maribacter sp.]|nr:TlpA family protein disulfide reductase [Maribacter sp.]